MEIAEVVNRRRPGRLQPLSTKVVGPRRGLQASSHVQSLSGVPPPGRLPTFYRKSSYRLTCRPGANVYEHTQTLILWLIYCMTLKLECTFAINPLPVLFKHATIIYLRELIPSPWLARMNVNLSWTVKLDHFLLRPFSILLVHLWVRSLRSTQIQSSGV